MASVAHALRVAPGQRVRLRKIDPADTSAFRGGKHRAEAEARQNIRELDGLQELLYANHSHSVLIVLQALDTGGKDGTIRHVFEGVNPQGVRVAKFREPTPAELDHDFLWRVHPAVPARGEMVIFNRSHYEDVLAARVLGKVPKDRWERRYRAINGFERSLGDSGTIVLKFFLHISPTEQQRRLRARLEDPTKHWKLSATDFSDQPHWEEYLAAIEEMLRKTSPPNAPWYLVPADKKWFRNWAVSAVLVEALRSLRLKWPPLPHGIALPKDVPGERFPVRPDRRGAARRRSRVAAPPVP